MPKRHEYPLPRPKYGYRIVTDIRGMPHWQLKEQDKKRNKNARAAYDRRRKLKARIEREIDKMAKELSRLDKAVAERERIHELESKAPSVKQMRAAVVALFKEEDLDPIRELIKLVKTGKLNDKDKAVILKELAQYVASKPKSVDIQADMDMHVSVGMVDFRNTSKAVVDASVKDLTDDDYEEFEVMDE